MFVAIDFENIWNIEADLSSNLISQVGLATLDTREIGSSKPAKLISTYNFATGPTVYCPKVRKKFQFGQTSIISQEQMRTKIKSCIPRNRKIILVGHGIRHELYAAQHAKVRLSSKSFNYQ